MTAEALSNVVPLVPVTDELAPKPETPAKKNEREVYRLIEASFGAVGGIDSAAEIMGIDRGDLRRAIDGKGRYLAVEHVMRFCERLTAKSPEAAMRIAAAIMRPFDAVVFPRVQLTAAERARRHENTLRRIGDSMGIDLVSQSLETP